MVYLNSGILVDAITAEIADALTSMDAAAVERIFAARFHWTCGAEERQRWV